MYSLLYPALSGDCVVTAEWASAAGRGGGRRYISRLDAVKEAVARHLDHMALTFPNNTVRQFSLVVSSYHLQTFPLNSEMA
jgi:hypothetical protein